MNTLTKNGVVIELPDGLWWSDQFSWNRVAETVTRSVTGAVIRQRGVRTGARPVTIESIAAPAGCITRQMSDVLSGWADDPAAEMTLLWFNQTYTVCWRYAGETSAYAAVPMWLNEADQSGDLLTPTLRLQTL